MTKSEFENRLLDFCIWTEENLPNSKVEYVENNDECDISYGLHENGDYPIAGKNENACLFMSFDDDSSWVDLYHHFVEMYDSVEKYRYIDCDKFVGTPTEEEWFQYTVSCTDNYPDVDFKIIQKLVTTAKKLYPVSG